MTRMRPREVMTVMAIMLSSLVAAPGNMSSTLGMALRQCNRDRSNLTC